MTPNPSLTSRVGQRRVNTPSWVYRGRLTGRLWNTTSCHGSSTHSRVSGAAQWRSTALQWAAARGYPRCVKVGHEFDFKEPVETRLKSRLNCKSLFIETLVETPIIELRTCAALKLLLRGGADVCATDAFLGRTPLHDAAAGGHAVRIVNSCYV